MGKDFEALLIPGAGEPARLRDATSGACQEESGGQGVAALPPLNEGEGQAPYLADGSSAEPGWFFGGVPFLDALWQIDWPPQEIPAREGETSFDYFFIAATDILWALNERFGPPSGWPSQRELDFLFEAIIAYKRKRDLSSQEDRP